MSQEQRSSVHIILIGLVSVFGVIGVLAYFWPQDLPVTHSNQIKAQSKPQDYQITQTVSSELLPVQQQKRDSKARVGLGASLAAAPLPEPKSRVSISKDLHLGEHLIHLKGGEWRLRVTITLTSDNPEFSRYASPLRRRLIQMLFFLVSHRVPEAMRTVDGEERLRYDLYKRYKNVLRNQYFELYFDGFGLEEVEHDYE